MADTSRATKTRKTLQTLHGTLLAGTTGFALGGPLGALIGTALGATYDRARQALFAVADIAAELDALDDAPPVQQQPQQPAATKAQEAAFTIGVIALGAKLARLGKKLDRETLEQFRAAFRLPPADIPLIKRMFEAALFDSVGHRPYADQLRQVFAGNTLLLEALLQGLARFAKDSENGAVALPVLEYLGALAAQFGVAPGKLEEILRREGIGRAPTNSNRRQTAWDLLGVPSGAPEIVVKQAYRALVIKCHPDLVAASLRADNDDAGALAAANERMAMLNAAYAEIKKSRGWA